MGIHRASHYHNCMGCLYNDILRRAKINGFFANDWLPLPLQYWCWIRTSKESVYVVEGVVLLYIYGIFILQQMRHSLIGITKPSFIKVLYLYRGQYPSLWWSIWLMPSPLHIPCTLFVTDANSNEAVKHRETISAICTKLWFALMQCFVYWSRFFVSIGV